MAFIEVPLTAMFELRFALHGRTAENTLYYSFVGGPTDVNCTALANFLASWWEANMAPDLSQDITLREVYWTSLLAPDAPTGSNSAGTPQTGNVPTAALPGSNAACISLRTAARGRSARGRNYIAGIPESGVTGNQLDSSLLVNIPASYELLLLPGTPGSPSLVVVSRFTNNAPRPVGVTRAVTQAIFATTRVASQRGRLTGASV